MKSHKFEFLDHTADAKFRAYGRTVEEAFSHAAEALTSLMWDRDRVVDRAECKVLVEGRDIKQLLVRFLEEIIYLLDAKGFLLRGADDVRISGGEGGYRLTARLRGDHALGSIPIFGEVKGITYNDMLVERNERVMVQVVVDV